MWGAINTPCDLLPFSRFYATVGGSKGASVIFL